MEESERHILKESERHILKEREKQKASDHVLECEAGRSVVADELLYIALSEALHVAPTCSSVPPHTQHITRVIYNSTFT